MYLVRETFQVKFGHMDAVLGAMRQATESGRASGMFSRALTDATGDYFTLEIESKVESLDEFYARMREAFGNRDEDDPVPSMMEHMEGGHRRIYNIEWEA